ncbi:MaoC/PaaZ C-terminal domain-containing protein [Flavobacterium paronense]|uniref:MaoC/PaaZ C-terminal domain-containing protein n=1 Tax=Flavobacterium paronense TaxID=1392775 RepID=A0ABV5GB38_9FLAO|nr:MaoC/PaaZ C-terminal domain-containing protein [Flavobacterium paronense]MDN3675785.1 MaoC/PaaZ C-terminal domain-containing protein [Flavobacterium paronense]MDN3675799.1 MaoC/PaaZ C-terminal domain-containing protein [Flavobacterium paronense]MDN3676838.1 MaoC/PaaZ C-terminal domain-containing protein [Flavobacterium paronense]
MMFKVDDTFVANFIVSEEIYNGFVVLFKDKNPLHTNRQFATENGFKSEVMHGNILNGFLSYFIGECLPIKNVIIHSQEIQFKNAVYLNDKLEFNAKVTGIYESVKAVEFKYDFKNADGKIVAKGKIQIGLLE